MSKKLIKSALKILACGVILTLMGMSANVKADTCLMKSITVDGAAGC